MCGLAAMSRVVRCECCDLPVYSCGKSAEDGQRKLDAATRRWLINHGWFTAQWPGVCGRCCKPFYSQTLIHPDGLATYIAECCAPETP